MLCKQWSLIRLFSKHCCEVLSARQTNAGGMGSKVHRGGCSYTASHAEGFPSAHSSPPVCRRGEADNGLLVAAFWGRHSPAWEERWERRRGHPHHEMLGCGAVPARTIQRRGEQQLSPFLSFFHPISSFFPSPWEFPYNLKA